MAAVADHTDFRQDAWTRIERTRDYVRTVTFGTRAQATTAARRVNAIHRRVSGVDGITGLPYRADDPELLLWVHAVLVDSELTAHHRFGPPLAPGWDDAYVREMAAAAELVGIPRRTVPGSAAENLAYLEGVPGLMVTPAARAGLAELLRPPRRRRVIPLWGVALAAAISILPDHVRRGYGIRWSPLADAPVALAMGGLAWAAAHVLPAPSLREPGAA